MDAIQAWLVTQLANLLGVEQGEIDIREPFAAYGIPSSEAVVLSGDLGDWLGRRLSPTLLWEYPTIEALARHLAEDVSTPGGEQGPQAAHQRQQLPSLAGATGRKVAREPIAIIGIGCRFPGASGPEAFWQLLREGRDAITEVPAMRWDLNTFYDTDPEQPGKLSTRWGGFLEHVDQFDPHFFGISPHEAARMDPQQRLLLEVSWEALEHAGLAPNRLYGSETGVFVGISSSDYSLFQLHDPALVDAYTGTGNAHSIAANRISYLLDLRGPSLAVDTACSSSLVAVHLACQSLRQQECSLALAGGVNLTLTPQLTVAFSKAQMMAADGRCKTFDAAADGYVRGEGCGVIILKRLSDALAEGDAIMAIILGSAVNQDGLSNGLTAPNGQAQQTVIRKALEQAGVNAPQIGYVETHGTGTPLGDPIEIRALTAVLGLNRAPDRTCAFGSVKTNIGHLEAAAGIAGLIKTILMVQQGEIPPHLHFKQLNPHISLDRERFFINTERQPWPAGRGARIAGVSSFGFGGTNAHVILGEAPLTAASLPPAKRPLHLLTLSAQSETALRSLAGRYSEWLQEHQEASLADVCFTANSGRLHFPHRLASAAGSSSRLRDQLSAFAGGGEAPGLISGRLQQKQPPRVAFLFTGQGSQYVGMGRELYATQQTFRDALDRCAELLKPHLGLDIRDVLYPELAESHQTFGAQTLSTATGRQETADAGSLDHTWLTQPALFALEYALAVLWQSWGVTPTAVLGHSVGEYVAACIAGVFPLEDGLRLVAARGRLMQMLTRPGEMVAVSATEAQVNASILPYADQVSIAAVNGPLDLVISGAREAVQAVVAELGASGVKTRRLAVSHAFHSPLMDPLLDAFEAVAAEVSCEPPRITLISNVTGRPYSEGQPPQPEYWRHHVRETVRFADGMEALAGQGCEIFLEVGPSATLLGMGQRCVLEGSGVWLPSLRKGRRDWEQLLASVAELYIRGVKVDWAAFDRAYVRRRVALPTYPFERHRCWIELPAPNARWQAPAPAGVESPRLVEWLHELAWQLKPRRRQEQPSQPHLGTAPKHWLIFADGGNLGTQLAEQIRAHGETCTLVFPGETFLPGQEACTIRPLRGEDYRRLLEELCADGAPLCHYVLYLWGLDRFKQEAAQGCSSALLLMQALGVGTCSYQPRLWLVTRGVQPAGAEHGILAVEQAPLWGLGRVLALEHPELWGGLVDLDPCPSRDEGVRLLSEVRAPDGEDQIALRGTQRYVARLTPLPRFERQTYAWRSDATYLIIGGLGALGLKVARYMVERGARHLVLLNRRAFPSRSAWASSADDGVYSPQIRELQALETLGANIHVLRADVSDQGQMAAVFAELRRAHPVLRGVIHAAGVASQRPLHEIDLEILEATLRPKVLGAQVLHQLTEKLELDFFVTFSSVASVLGSQSLAHYACANLFLDALAHHRRALGLPGLSINWGPWSGGGLASLDDQAAMARVGMAALKPEAALEVLEHLLGSAVSQVLVAQIDWRTFLPVYESRARRPLVEAVAGRLPELPVETAGKPELVRELEEAPAAMRRQMLEAYLQREVARVLGLELTAGIEPEQGFFELGMDSLMAVDLKRRLETQLGISLPRTTAFDFPTIATLAAFLLNDLLRLELPSAQIPLVTEQQSQRRELLSEIKTLSDQDVEARLLAELERLNY